MAEAAIKQRETILHGYTRQLPTPVGMTSITINSDDEGPFEVFINVGRAGNDVAAMAEAIGRLCSLILRIPSTVPPAKRLAGIAAQLRDLGSSRSVWIGADQVKSLPDGIAKVLDQHN